MNDNTPVPGYAFQAGRILAGLHYKIVPIGPGKKYPPIQAWQDAATDDLVQVAQWLAETNYGIGWAMGLQPNGKHLFCLDIDGDLGVASLAELVIKRGGEEAFTATCQQQTGSGGWHYIFESEFEVRNSASQFAPGIDIRGEGGQIVVGPTIHPNGQAYRWVKGPKRNPPQLAPAWVMDRIAAQEVRPPEVPSLATVPQASPAFQVRELVVTQGWYAEPETPFEWLNRTFDSAASLRRMGWLADKMHGYEQQFTRPGKDPRQGTSATCHLDTGVVNVFSTSVDTIYHTVGKAGNGCITLTPADLWMVENHVTDRSEASRMIRRLMPAGTGAAAYTAPVPVVQGDSTVEIVPTSANLPDEFWESRPYLAHIRQACHNRGASADAVLGAVIARFAASIPPPYRIPALIQVESTFDHMSVLVAESAGGKSGAMGLARRLFPGPQYDDMVWDAPLSTGEGLVSAFFEMKEEEDGGGKKKFVNKKTKMAVHFGVDEMLGLVEVAGRAGATIGSVLCTAWSGGDPGQLNASADRKRVGMHEGTYRMAGVAGIQLSLGHRLLEDTFIQQGLSGRLVFFAAEDPSIIHPDERPEWPGPLELPTYPRTPLEIVYAPAIERTIQVDNWEKMTKKVHVAPIDGHLNLVRLKMSGIFALMEGRTAVTESDWELANIVVTSHLTLRNRMLEAAKQHRFEEGVTKATAAGAFEDIKDETRERKAQSRLRDSIIRRVPEEGIAKNPLRKLVAGSPAARDRFPLALQKALDDGAIKSVDGRYFPT